MAIAKLVRADIKAAVKAGTIPAAKYGVRTERYSGGQSLKVNVSALSFEVLSEERVLLEHDEPHAYHGGHWMSEGAKALEKALDAICDAYNFDGSDIQTDYFHVNFYANVTVDYDGDAERLAILARNGRLVSQEGGAA